MIRLSHETRRRIGLAVFALGALWVAHELVPASPRTVEIHVAMRPFRGETVENVGVTLLRDGNPVRVIRGHIGAEAPAVWTGSVSIPTGEYTAEVDVQLRDRVEHFALPAVARAGEVMDLRLPVDR